MLRVLFNKCWTLARSIREGRQRNSKDIHRLHLVHTILPRRSGGKNPRVSRGNSAKPTYPIITPCGELSRALSTRTMTGSAQEHCYVCVRPHPSPHMCSCRERKTFCKTIDCLSITNERAGTTLYRPVSSIIGAERRLRR